MKKQTTIEVWTGWDGDRFVRRVILRPVGVIPEITAESSVGLSEALRDLARILDDQPLGMGRP